MFDGAYRAIQFCASMQQIMIHREASKEPNLFGALIWIVFPIVIIQLISKGLNKNDNRYWAWKVLLYHEQSLSKHRYLFWNLYVSEVLLLISPKFYMSFFDN